MNENAHKNIDNIYGGGAVVGRFRDLNSEHLFERSSSNRRNSLIGGALAVLLYLLLFGAVMVFIAIDKPTIDEDSYYAGSILVSFGDDSAGSGEAARGGARNSLLTQAESEVKMESAEGQQPLERTVNSRALFPGTDSSSHDLDQGQSEGAGATSSNQNGEQESEQGNAESLSGNYSLEGRKLIGDLPLPDYLTDAYGRVIVAITVDEDGRVTTARLEPIGSTTNNTILIEAARRAALKAQFSASTELLASGTITYIFRMN